ncbi:MAG: hypothetical protein QM601_10175 [Pseudoxanthomonas sp.]
MEHAAPHEQNLLDCTRFRQRMTSVARHLLISTSHAYRCCAKAHWLTTCQHALELAPSASMAAMKPWRKRCVLRTARQMAFDFDEQLPFAADAYGGFG